MKSIALADLKHLLRLRQWVKNLFIFAPLLFSKSFLSFENVWLTTVGFFAFSLAASATYIINDIVDRDDDRHHPKKKNRPIASGSISITRAITIAGILLFISFFIGFLLHPSFTIFILLYTALNTSYSLLLKKVPILDVMCIAFGFVIRILAGAVPLGLSFSPWLIASTFFLTLTLAIYKRSNEHIHMLDKSREVLQHYNQAFLKQIGTVTATMALMTYTLYTWNTGHSFAFIATVPFAVYGVFRYLLIMEHKKTTDDGPVDDLFADRPLQISIFLWIITTAIILIMYG